MKNTSFGLDIGGSTMKAVWLTPQGRGGFLLNAATTFPTPPKGMLSSSPLDEQEMAQAIRNLVSEARISTKYVNIALPENQVYTRVLEMPPLSDKELSSAIFWEAEQYIPVPLTTIVLDWTVLRRPFQGELETKMKVLLVGAPTNVVDRYKKIIEMAGLIVNGIETEILSVVRAVANPTMNTGAVYPNSLIIHIGAIGTLLAIIREGIIVFTYFVPIGGVAITRAISSDFGFTTTQAEEYKRVYGYSSKTLEGKIGKATEPILMSILGEVRKALTFYNEKYKEDSPITQIVLSGGTAKLPGIGIFFAQQAGIEAVTANPWKILVSQQVPKEVLESAPDYTIAIGLAMKNNG